MGDAMATTATVPPFLGARDLFESARAASVDAERIRRQLDAMAERAEGLGGGGFEPRVRSTGEPDRMGARVAAMVDQEANLRRRAESDYATIELACAVLYGTDSDAGLSVLVPSWWCDVLWWRYLGCETWERVGAAVGYSPHRCWEVAQTALDVADGWGLVSVMRGRGRAEGA